MSGYGIDLVDTFFGSITGTWARLAKFFGTCWLASGLTAVCLSLFHSFHGWGWDGSLWNDWYFWPQTWAFSLVYACFVHWWFGIPFFIYFVGCFIHAVWNDGSMRRSLALLAILQGWHTWGLWILSDHRIEMIWSRGETHPLILLMILATGILAWVARRP